MKSYYLYGTFIFWYITTSLEATQGWGIMGNKKECRSLDTGFLLRFRLTFFYSIFGLFLSNRGQYRWSEGVCHEHMETRVHDWDEKNRQNAGTEG